MVARCRKDGRDGLIAGMEHYYDPDDFNRCFYHATGDGSRSESRSADRRLAAGKHLAVAHSATKLLAGKGACENHPQRRGQAS